MPFGPTPTDGSQTPIPMSSVVPWGTGAPVALEGGSAVTVGGITLAAVSVWVKDGNDATQGFSTDAANANTVMGQLKQIKTNTASVTIGSGTVIANAGTGNFNNAAIGNTGAAVPASGVYISGNKAGNLTGVSLDGSGNLNVNVAAGGGAGGTSSTFGVVYPGTGTAVGASDGTNMKALLVDASGFLKVNVAAGGSGSNASVGTDGSAIPTSSTLIGASDGTNLQQLLVESAANRNLRTGIYSGATEATVTGANALKVDNSAVTQPISGTITANAGTGNFTVAQATGTNLHTVLDTGSTTAVTQATGTNLHTVVDSGSITATQATGTNLHTVVDSGTVAATQSGTWTVQPGNTANTTAWKVDASSTTVPVSGTFWQATQPISGTVTAAQATASSLNAQVVGSVASAGANAGNPVKIGGAFNTTQPTVTTGQIVDAQMTSRGAQIVATGTDTFNAAVSGTVTANAGTNLNTSTLALESGGNLATLAGAITSAKVQENVAQINGVTPLMGNGVTGTGSQRVTIASDNTAFSVNAVQSGTFTVQPGNTANTTPWLATISQGGNSATVASLTNSKALAVEIVDGSGTQITTFGGSSASTSATGSAVPASGTYIAGNKAGNLTGVSMDASGNINVNVAAGGGSGGTSSTFSAAFPGTGTAAGASDGTNMKPLLVDASGFLKVNVSAGGGAGGTSSTFGAAFPGTGTALGASDGTNMQGLLVESSSNKNLRVALYNGATEASVTGSNALKVDGSAVTQPVSGTFWQATQPISGTVTANAGTNLNTSALALDTSVNGVIVAQGSTTSGEKGALVQGAVTTGAPTYTTAQTSPISLTTAGALRVDASTTTQPVSGTFWQATQPISGTVTANAGTGNFTVVQATGTNLHVVADSGSTTAVTSLPSIPTGANTIGAVTQASGPWTANITQVGGTNVVTGTGVSGAGIPRVTVSNDSNVQVWDGTNKANVLAATSASNAIGAQAAQLVAGADQEVTFTTTTAQAVATTDVTNYRWISVQINAQGTSSTVTFQGSNDNTNWFSVSLVQPSQSAAATVTNTGATGIWHGPLTTRYFRLSVAGISAGTTSGVVEFHALPSSLQTYSNLSTQSGTWTVQPGNTANTTAWKVDGSAVTQPVSAASLPLPTGASTSAKQPALGTAGTASTDVLSVQGIASMTALKVDGSGVTQPVSGTFWQTTQPVSGTVTANVGTTNGIALDTSVNGVIVAQSSTTAGEKGTLIQGAVTTGSPTYTTAQTNPISLTTAGAIRVDASATTQPISGTVAATQSGTWTVQPGNTANTTAWKVDGSAVTQPVSGTFWQATQPVSGTVTANAGTNLNTSALALDTSVNGMLVSQGSTTSGEKGPIIQGAVTTAAPTYTTAQTNPLSLDTAGLLRASLKDTPSNTNNFNVNLAASAATVTVSATNLQTNLNQIAGSAIATAATGIMKVGLTDGTGTAITSTSNALDINIKSGGGSGFSVADEAAWTAGTSAFVPTGGVFNDTAAALTTGQQGAIRLTNNRAIHVNLRDASANQLLGSKTSANSIPVVVASDQGAVPVSGTVTANAGTGNFTVVQATGTNLHAVLDTGSTTAATQATAANLNAQVVGAVASAGANAGNPIKTGGVFNTTQPTVTNGQIVDLQSTARGAQIVATGADTFNAVVTGTVTANAGTNLNTSLLALETGGNLATLAGAITSTRMQANVSQINGVTPLMGNGVSGTGAQRVTLASDSTGQVTLATGANTIGAVTQASGPWTANITQVGSTNIVTGGVAGLLAVGGPVASGASNADNPVKIGAVFNTTQPTVTNGQVVDIQATARGANIVATGADAFTVQPGNTANTTPWLASLQATTAGGSTPSHTISAASTNATSTKASAGLVYGFCISNANAAARYFKLYNKASAPTVGTDTPVMTIQIPGSGTVIRAYPVGLTFSTGIAWATTTGIADANAVAVGAADLSIDLDWK